MDLRSGAAFWPIRDGLLATYPPLERDERADVAVVGAGITGALVAHHLAAAGANVVVLDKRDVGEGSTAATSGLLLYETDSSLLELTDTVGEANAVRAWRRGLEAIDEIQELCRTVGDSCGFSRHDTLYLASSARDARQLAKEHAHRARNGFDLDWMTSADLARCHGIDAPAAIYSRGGGQIDAFRFTHRLLQSAIAHGARVYDRTEVSRVIAHDDRVELETDRGSRVNARHMVWATGYESVEETQRRVGRFHSTWALVSEPLDDLGAWKNQMLIWETARPYLYARVTDDRRVMIGGEDEPFSRHHASARRMEKKSAKLVKRFAQIFPELPFEVAYKWAGVFSTTVDGLPYIGSVPEHPHAWLALGYGGNGITFSAIAASLIRDAWIRVPNADAALFSFDRHR